MIYFLMAIGIGYIIIQPIIILIRRRNKAKVTTTNTKEENPISNEAKEFAEKVLNEVNKIIECSKQTTDNLRSDLEIKTPAILFEQIAF